MPKEYEINEMGKDESWRMFRIMGELIEGFDELSAIGPAVTIYGSARLLMEDPLYAEVESIARRLAETGFAVITGGGGGVMEAANKGAYQAGASSIGLSIDLPSEQSLNPYTTKSIRFHHFFARKVMLVKYATAFIIMPGGWGTLDELSEVVTLIQTEKIKPFPVILFKTDYWEGLLQWFENNGLARHFVSEADMDILRVCDDPDQIVDVVQNWYLRNVIVGRKVLNR